MLGAVKATLTRPTVFMGAAAAMMPESGTLYAAVRLITPTGAVTTCPVTVTYQTVAGTAATGLDFSDREGTLTFGRLQRVVAKGAGLAGS